MKRAPSAKPGSTLGNKRSSNAQDTVRYRLTATTSPTRSNSKTVAVDSFAGIPQAKTATAMAATPPNDVLEKPMMTAPAAIAANSGQPNVAIRSGTRRLYWVVRTRGVLRTDPDAGVRCPVSGVRRVHGSSRTTGATPLASGDGGVTLREPPAWGAHDVTRGWRWRTRTSRWGVVSPPIAATFLAVAAAFGGLKRIGDRRA